MSKIIEVSDEMYEFLMNLSKEVNDPHPKGMWALIKVVIF